jgi:hypothetical protein
MEPIKPLRLAQSEMEHGPERQRCQDRQRRIPSLPASGCPGRGSPGRDRHVGEPYRQAPALAQARVMGRPVHHLARLLRDVVATRGVGLERYCGIPDQNSECLLSQPTLRRQPLIRATTPRSARISTSQFDGFLDIRVGSPNSRGGHDRPKPHDRGCALYAGQNIGANMEIALWCDEDSAQPSQLRRICEFAATFSAAC